VTTNAPLLHSETRYSARQVISIFHSAAAPQQPCLSPCESVDGGGGHHPPYFKALPISRLQVKLNDHSCFSFFVALKVGI
jgi:hypothetical protein